jgi:hypothetical protein
MFKIPETIFTPNVKTDLVKSPPSHIVNPIIGLYIDGGTTNLSLMCGGTVQLITPAPRNPLLDITFNCEEEECELITKVELFGDWLNVYVDADPLEVEVDIDGDFIYGLIYNGLCNVVIILRPNSDFIVFTQPIRGNWVKWSDIGSLDFEINESNIAGEMPLDWKGWIYGLLKYDKIVLAYGENGVSILTPASVGDFQTFGFRTIYRVGLKSKNAFTGTDNIHFFVDRIGRLCKFNGELKVLGYSEYLSKLSDSVLSMNLDEENNLVYICDGVLGFVYNYITDSFGEGANNITGFGRRSGYEYITSPDVITTPDFEIWTDILDMNSKKFKTIHSIECGANVSNKMYGTIEYRNRKKANFIRLPWQRVDPFGIAHITCCATEFKVGLKVEGYEYFELDYLKIKGVIE